MPADLILVNGRFTTLDRANPNPEAVAIREGRFDAVGDRRELMAGAEARTRVIDLQGRRVVPGLMSRQGLPRARPCPRSVRRGHRA